MEKAPCALSDHHWHFDSAIDVSETELEDNTHGACPGASPGASKLRAISTSSEYRSCMLQARLVARGQRQFDAQTATGRAHSIAESANTVALHGNAALQGTCMSMSLSAPLTAVAAAMQPWWYLEWTPQHVI
jgi:hypothetical protein